MRVALGSTALLSLLSLPTLAADVGLAGSFGGSDAGLAIPIRFDSLIIQPEISYSYYDDKKGYEHESGRFGVFAYKVFHSDKKVNAELGVGIGYALEEDNWSHNKSESDGYFIAPSVGLFYEVTEQVSIGVQARYTHQKMTGHNTDSYSDDAGSREKTSLKTAYNYTQIVARYFL